MLNTNFTSRLSASPWWPLVRWLGLPATLSNISIACWPVLQFHWVLSADPYSLTGGGGSWFDILGFATMATMLLVAVQVLVASLLLACSAGPFRLRLAAYAGYLLWLAGSLAVGFTMSQCLLFGLEGFRASSGVIIHDTYITFGAGPILAAMLPTFLLAIQSPYWLLRIFGGRRLQRPELDEPAGTTPRAESLSIRNLLEATASVAMCLGLLQLGDQHAGQATPGSFVLNTLAMAGVAAALTLFVGLPFLDLFLRNMRLDVAWAITLATVFICTAALAVVAYAYGPGANFWETVVKTFFNFLILFCAYALALSLLRLYGWRLVGRVRQDARQPK